MPSKVSSYIECILMHKERQTGGHPKKWMLIKQKCLTSCPKHSPQKTWAIMLDFISKTEHFTMVLDLAVKAKETLWIGTADIKDLYVVQG